mmetsp:Transcript_9121/g.19716  ORF Transcript_9121/g.19716 Transcript_9121/m.19716 type:complete len:202 (-) Transcript_9121:30-635(-)
MSHKCIFVVCFIEFKPSIYLFQLLFRQTIQRLRKTLHARSIIPSSTTRTKTSRRILPHPLVIFLPLPIKPLSRRHIVHPPPNRQIQRRAIEPVHLFQLLARDGHAILGIEIILDFDRFFDPQHHGDDGVFVVVETGAGLGAGEISKEFHEEHVVVDAGEEDAGDADGGGDPYWDCHVFFIDRMYVVEAPVDCAPQWQWEMW